MALWLTVVPITAGCHTSPLVSLSRRCTPVYSTVKRFLELIGTAFGDQSALEPGLYPAMLIWYSLSIYPLHMIYDAVSNNLQKISAHQENYQIFPFLGLVMCWSHYLTKENLFLFKNCVKIVFQNFGHFEKNHWKFWQKSRTDQFRGKLLQKFSDIKHKFETEILHVRF